MNVDAGFMEQKKKKKRKKGRTVLHLENIYMFSK